MAYISVFSSGTISPCEMEKKMKGGLRRKPSGTLLASYPSDYASFSNTNVRSSLSRFQTMEDIYSSHQWHNRTVWDYVLWELFIWGLCALGTFVPEFRQSDKHELLSITEKSRIK